MRFSYILIFFIVLSVSTYGQSLNKTIKEIIEINEVQYERIGRAGEPSENYKNYEILKKKANISELLELVNHENKVVACYASWALIEKKYPDLSKIFISFLKSDNEVTTFSGCIKSSDHIASEFYHFYWNKVTDKAKDKKLFSLDSIVLYQNKPDWLLLYRALDNRIYSKSFNKRIEELAFENNYKEAIFYLSNWHKADYVDQIKEALVKYIKRTNFKDIGTTAYYEVVEELLKFKDKEIDELVIDKLKKDKHWMHQEEVFEFLFDRYYIFEDFSK